MKNQSYFIVVLPTSNPTKEDRRIASKKQRQRWNVTGEGKFSHQRRTPMLTDARPGFTDAELLENMPALRNFARRFHNSANDIDDLVQETLANDRPFR
ncbi:hypothetical protein [Rhizobium sp. BK008]|uniref:hypothetical protein n=1 Tax=Rhizobium sp. BK008 TaxID=2587094 RepID=UPI0017ABC490|nr:hypothetical protein [Rhizobium sp. BK008]MBB4255726.1 hypothetical protein [Rhizobium sp. BK008]